ncbi:Protein TolB [bacterium HR16]|nr:Protein TolB [bacterium HR16]
MGNFCRQGRGRNLLNLATSVVLTCLIVTTSRAGGGFPPELLWFRPVLEPVSLSYSGSQQVLAVPARQGTIALYRISDGTLMSVIPAHDNRVNTVAFSPDGNLLASGSDDMTVKIWQVSDYGRVFSLQRSLQGHTSWVNAVAFSPDGSLLASASRDGTVRIWRVSDGTLVRTLTGHNGSVTSVAFSPDGQYLASGSEDGKVRIWNTSDGLLVRTLSDHVLAVRSVAFSPNGQLIASGGDDRNVRIWQVSDGALVRTLSGHSGSVTSVAFSPDGQYLVSGSEDRDSRIWRVNDGTLERTLAGHTFAVRSLTFLSGGGQIASGSEDKTVRIWEVSSGSLMGSISEHTNDPTAVAVYPDDTRIASAGKDGLVILRDLLTGRELNALSAHNNWVTSVAFSSDGQWMATASRDNTVRLWDARTGVGPVATLLHPNWVHHVAFSPDNTLLASACEDRHIRLWNTAGGLVRDIDTRNIDPPVPAEYVYAVAFSRDNTLVAGAMDDGTVRIWRVSDGSLVRFWNAHSGRVYSVAFSRAGNLIASAGLDGRIRLWNTTDWSLRGELSGHEGPVYSVAFSADGSFLVSGGEDNTVRYWSVPDLAPLKVLRGHTTAVRSVAFSRDGIYVASAGDDAVALWRVREAPYNAPPFVPEIFAPENGAVVPPTPTFDLRAEDANGDRVRFVLELVQGETTLTAQTDLVDSGRRLTYTWSSELASGEWRWRVKAVDAKGSEGEWSTARTFIANRAPQVAEVLEPEEGVVVSPTPTFRLRAQDAEGDQVKFLLKLIQGESEQTLETPFGESGRSLTFTVPAELASGQWQYQVKAVDAKGSEGEWSTARTFIANRSPLAVEVIEPADGSVVAPVPAFVLRTTDAEGDRVRFVLELVQGETTLTAQTDLVDSGRRLTYTWSSELASGEWRWRVKAVDAKGSEGAATEGRFTVSGDVLVQVPAELSAWGLSLQVGNKTKADLGLADVPMRVWDPTTWQYREVAPDEILVPGRGYWMKPGATTRLIIGGAPVTPPFTIHLKVGWNHISSPLLTPVAWSSDTIRVRRNNEELTLTQARQVGWIAGYAWGWNTEQARYQLVHEPNIVPGAQTQLTPWQGYWIYAHQECDLVIAPSRRAQANNRLITEQTPGPWSIRWQVQLGTHLGGVFIGGSRSAQEVTIGLPPDPPSSSPMPKIYLSRQGTPLAVDLRAEGRADTPWEVVVQVPAGGADNATLVWQGTHTAPRGVTPLLVDLQTGERKFLRTTSSHTFAVSRQGGEYRFRIEMLPANQLLKIMQARVSGGRSTGGRYTISYQLSDAAQVEVSIVANGKVVRRLANGVTRSAGMQQVTWDGRDSNGIALPAGAYMAEIKASSSDGQVVRTILPIVLTR